MLMMPSMEERTDVPRSKVGEVKDTSLMWRRAYLATSAKVWIATGMAFLVAAIGIRLGWEFVAASSAESFATISLSILAVLGIGGLVVFFILRPEKLASRAVSTGAVVAVALGLIGGLVHYIRFVFISGVPPLAKVIATALALASVCGFVAMLYALRWLNLKRGEIAAMTGARKGDPSPQNVEEEERRP